MPKFINVSFVFEKNKQSFKLKYNRNNHVTVAIKNGKKIIIWKTHSKCYIYAYNLFFLQLM